MSATPKPTLGPVDFAQAEYESTRYVAKIEQGIAPETLLDPNYWAHHSHKLRPWDQIEARAKDGTWMAEFVVTDCSRTWAKLKQLTFYTLTTGDVAISQASDQEITERAHEYRVIHRGPRGWSVVRVADKTVMHEEEPLREGAEAWLTNHVALEVKGKRAATTV